MIKVYVSHSIRGLKGSRATKKDMRFNCDRIKLLIGRVRECLPEVEFYVPGEQEEFVGLSYTTGQLNEKQILDIDCSIVKNCNAVAVFLPDEDSELQGGRKIEADYALSEDIPVIEFASAGTLIRNLNRFLGVA